MIVAVVPPSTPPTWHALSDAPLRFVAATYRAAGTDIHHLPALGTPQAEHTP